MAEEGEEEIFREEAEDPDSQALQLGFELALKERDAALRDQAQAQDDLEEAHRRLDSLLVERDRALRDLDSLSKSPASLKSKTSGSSLHRSADADESHLVEESGDNVVWQIHKVTLQRVANYGFGIAVSGGHDSPHFASGDPSIAISDVLKAGPAEGKLQLNDRIISANGISLENVSHSMAIQVLKNSGDSVNLVVRRRVVMPAAVEKESPPLRVTLLKKSKKDEFGLVLGCRFFIQDVLPDSLAAHDGGLKIGDTILKVNNTPLEGLSMGEVKKLIERSKDRLQLIVSKSTHSDNGARYSATHLRDDEGYATFRPPHDKDDINLFRGDSLPDRYAAPGSAHFDARYGYEQDAPPRPPMPGTFPRSQPRNEGPPHSPNREPGRAENFYSPAPRREPDGYYSDHDMDGYRGPPEEDIFARHPHDEHYVGLRSDVGMDIRRVLFQKDRQKGLGLRLAGGNATGIFIASVQPGSGAEAEGLVEGDQILQANGLDIVGLTREEAVAHLTGLEGQVTLIVQYRKEDYESIMASHEAGDSFYIRTHFSYQPSGETGDHGFKVGDIFHIKDTLFRGVGGSWLAIKVGPNGEELKKGTIPNKKKAESLASAQQESSGGRDPLPNKGRGSLFKRKSARRAKSLGKDHWEEVIFSGLSTKFPPYERVVLRDPAFVRPVVVFGAIADMARDMLLKEYPDRFESPQVEKGADNENKKGQAGVIRFGAIREAIDRKKHCVLDVTPYHVDRLNYAQYYPIVVLLKGESKQAIKEVRSRWRGSAGSNKNPKKLQELNEKMDSLYAHLFTGVIVHTTTDVWFPKLVEMVQSQQRRPVWMSEKKPDEDFNDDFMFPMPNRLSMAAAPDHDLDLARTADDLDISPMQKKRLVRSSSDPSINTGDRIPGIPPYPAPPGYRQDRKLSPYDKGREEWDDYRHPVSTRDRDGDWQMHPDDRYYPHPHHPPDSWSPHYQSSQPPHPHSRHSRSNIDVYATITPSERVRKRPSDNDYVGPHDDYGPHRDRLPPDDPFLRSGPRSPHDPNVSPSQPPGPAGDHRGYTDASSNDNDSYSRYVSSPANKHDDSKLRDKFSSLQVGAGPERNDPYRFTRSTANPVSNANIDRVKLLHLTARYRQEDRQGKPGTNKGGGPASPSNPSSDPGQSSSKKKEPPPVPAKTYSLKEVGMDPEEMKARNYENSNRAYNYSEIYYPAQQQPPPPPHGLDPRYPHDPNPPPPPHATTGGDSPYEYISARSVSARPPRRGDGLPPEVPPPPVRDDYGFEGGSNSRAFSNSVYMDQREVERARLGGGEHVDGDPGGYTRPRTDDEQLRDLQAQRHRTRLRSEPLLADRARSESRLDERSAREAAARWNKYKSWDSEKESQRTFNSYKKLITPGFYGSRKTMSKSHDELREEPGQDGAATRWPRKAAGGTSLAGGGGSAFESYNKKATGSSGVPLAERSSTTQKGGLTDDSLPTSPLPSPPSRPAFTEMASIPSQSLPPPLPPLPLVAILTTLPDPSANLNGHVEGSTSEAGRGPIRRQLSAKERYSRGFERSRMRSEETMKNKRASADLERRWVAGGNSQSGSSVDGWRRSVEKPMAGHAGREFGGSSGPGKDARHRKTPDTQSAAEVQAARTSLVGRHSRSAAGEPGHKGDGLMTSAPSYTVHQKKETDPAGSRVPVELSAHHPVYSKAEAVKSPDPKATSLELLVPQPSGEEPGQMTVEKTSSELPLPPPPPSHTDPAQSTASENLCPEFPLPPPPPPLTTTDVQKLNSAPPKSSPPQQVMPPPPPPPPLVVTPLPLVNGDWGEGEGKLRGKGPLKRLSGRSHLSPENDAAGEESGDGETSESVSTPDTVVAAGPAGQETEEHTVVATARGTFTSAGGVLNSEETGVSIVIPEGALEEGKTQDIYFKVCSASNVLPPLDKDKGETLLSPLVMCGPHGLRFRKPVELRLPHTACVNPKSWSFALKSSDSPAGQPAEWQNMSLAGSEGVAQGHVGQNSVSVLVDHF